MSSAKDLRPDPDLPVELKDAALNGRLVIFVGAGASMLVGMPSWSGLASKALEDLRDKGAINYAELQQLKGLDPKKQLSIAKLVASENKHDLKLDQYLKSNGSSRIYETLNSIGATCVTTNYDHELTPEYTEKVDASKTKPETNRISGVENLKSHHLKNPGTVIHLHGDMASPETMIVATKDYLEHYDHENVQHFLKELFETKVVLFVGYGLEEAEILEHILRRSGIREQEKERSRFALQPFFNSEQPLYGRLIEYYKKSFGVHLIGYTRDFKDYKQLEKIMNDWSSELDIRPPTLVDDIADIDRVIADE